MVKYIKHFSEIRKTDIHEVGGKGANLGELAGKGFPVPPGFVVTVKSYKTFFETLDLTQAIQQLEHAPPEKVEQHCSAIQNRFKNTEMPKEMADAILSAHKKLVENRGDDILCAVRSSATAEDLGEASFAGQHGTYYYVDEAYLVQRVKNCWASLWNQEAVCYRANHGIEHASVYMAVVVQEMIRSRISGITFTANPVTGAKEEIVTESCWGMGAAIVDGRVTPDHYIVERKSAKLREHRIADKRFMVSAYLKPGQTGRLEQVPHKMRQQETLSPELLKTIVRLAVNAEEHFGNPQDIEWAVADKRVYMLQSRPITAMGREAIGQDIQGKYLLFKPAVENFTDPLTPLTQDLFMYTVFNLFGLRFIGGRSYTNLKFWRPLLPFKLSDEDLVHLLYLSAATPPPMKLAPGKLPFFLLLLFYLYLAFGTGFARTGGMPDDFMDGFRKLCQEVEDDPSFGPVKTIRRLWSAPKIFDPLGNMPLWVNFSSVRYFTLLEILTKLVRRWIPDLREDAVTLLCSGAEGVLSTEMGRDIVKLAVEARRNEDVKKLFLEHPPETLISELHFASVARDFVAHLNRFLEKNGHRGLKELELQSARWAEDPTPVLGMIRNYLLADTDLIDFEEKVIQNRKAIETEIQHKLEPFPFERSFRPRWKLIRYLAKQVRGFAKLRENSRFYHIMAFYFVRKKILKIEKELLQRGELKCKDDIFFLKMDEIADMQAGKLGWFDVEDRLRERRIEHIRFSKMQPPKVIGMTLPEQQQDALEDGESTVLRGQAASPGSYEGIARVILNPSVDLELQPGEILVAPYTDPAWTPLFLTAGAAVVEVGSYLSHAGTIAREYGMPCVVDVADCTNHIQTGDRLRVDGNQGIVRIMN